MINHIHIFGATGSGTTTLGKALATKLGYAHFDIDNYLFESDSKQFTKPRRPVVRNTLLLNDLKSTSTWVVSGALCGWGDFVIRYFDLIIFLWVPPAERMRRLEVREEKLGRKVEDPAHPRYRIYKNFMKWAAEYDTADSNNWRSLAQQEVWLAKLTCPLLRIEGDRSVADNIKKITQHLKNY